MAVADAAAAVAAATAACCVRLPARCIPWLLLLLMLLLLQISCVSDAEDGVGDANRVRGLTVLSRARQLRNQNSAEYGAVRRSAALRCVSWRGVTRRGAVRRADCSRRLSPANVYDTQTEHQRTGRRVARRCGVRAARRAARAQHRTAQHQQQHQLYATTGGWQLA